MKTTTTSRKPHRSRAWNLIGTLIATAALLGAIQALAPVPALAMMDIGCEEVGECSGGSGDGSEPGGGDDGSEPGNGPWEGGREVGEDEGPEGGPEQEVAEREEKEASDWEFEGTEAFERQEEQEVAEQDEKQLSDAENKQIEKKEIDDAEEPERVYEEDLGKLALLGDQCEALFQEWVASAGGTKQRGFRQLREEFDECKRRQEAERRRLGVEPEENSAPEPIHRAPTPTPPRQHSAPHHGNPHAKAKKRHREASAQA